MDSLGYPAQPLGSEVISSRPALNQVLPLVNTPSTKLKESQARKSSTCVTRFTRRCLLYSMLFLFIFAVGAAVPITLVYIGVITIRPSIVPQGQQYSLQCPPANSSCPACPVCPQVPCPPCGNITAHCYTFQSGITMGGGNSMEGFTFSTIPLRDSVDSLVTQLESSGDTRLCFPVSPN